MDVRNPGGGFSDEQAKIFQSADILIVIPISETYSLGNIGSESAWKLCTKPNARLIKIPNLYFAGYNPELTYIYAHHDSSHITEYGLVLHDVRHIYLYLVENGWLVPSSFSNKPQPPDLLPFFSMDPDIILKNKKQHCDMIETLIQEVARREKDANVKMARFIQNNYKTVKLFHTTNHPTNLLLCELASEIARCIFPPDNPIYEKHYYSDSKEDDSCCCHVYYHYARDNFKKEFLDKEQFPIVYHRSEYTFIQENDDDINHQKYYNFNKQLNINADEYRNVIFKYYDDLIHRNHLKSLIFTLEKWWKPKFKIY